MATIWASPQGGTINFQGGSIKTFRLQTAFNRAEPGDIVELLPGRYTQPIVISDGGQPDKPVTLRGQPDLSVLLDGQQDRKSAADDFDPMDDDFAFIKLQSVDWLKIEHLAFENCWPTAIFIRGCKDIAGGGGSCVVANAFTLSGDGHLVGETGQHVHL